jgi:hypothetical protein
MPRNSCKKLQHKQLEASSEKSAKRIQALVTQQHKALVNMAFSSALSRAICETVKVRCKTHSEVLCATALQELQIDLHFSEMMRTTVVLSEP